MINEESAPSFTEPVVVARTVTKAKEDIDCIVFESYSDATGYNLQPPSKPVLKLPSDIRGEIQRPVTDLGVLKSQR